MFPSRACPKAEQEAKSRGMCIMLSLAHAFLMTEVQKRNADVLL